VKAANLAMAVWLLLLCFGLTIQFNRRYQKTGETVEIYATELKRIYEKAYTNRDARIRQEDLLQRFLMGIGNDKARIHIELNKDPCFLTFGQKQNLQLLPEVWAIIPAACLYCSNIVSVLPLQIYLSILPTKLVNELKNRFGVIENKKTYRVQFNRRNQKTGETVEIYATELKRIWSYYQLFQFF
jgi:hypothetical protein